MTEQKPSNLCMKNPNHTIISATLAHICVNCAYEESCTNTTVPKNLPDDYWHCPFKENCEMGKSWCDWPCDKWAVWHDAEVTRTATLAAYRDFDMWFSAKHVGGQSQIIPEVRQELHRRMKSLKKQGGM